MVMQRQEGAFGMFFRSKMGKDLIRKIPIVGDIDREVSEFMGDLRNELKEQIHDGSPEIGKVLDRMERISTTVDNGTTSVYNRDFDVIQTLLQQKKAIQLSIGDHISIRRRLPAPYTHHGIYVGDGEVIHFSEGEVRLDELNKFGPIASIRKVDSHLGCSEEIVVMKAYSRLGERGYNLIVNNCEHFALWCRSANYSTDNPWF